MTLKPSPTKQSRSPREMMKKIPPSNENDPLGFFQTIGNEDGWRREEKCVLKTPKVAAVDPSSFYLCGNRRSRESKEVKPAIIGAKLLLQEEKKAFIKDQKIRRAAFRDVTSLKTWPLQKVAFDDLDELMRIHCGIETTKSNEDINQTSDSQHTTNDSCKDITNDPKTNGICCEFEEDSTGISSSSIDEPKRCKELISSINANERDENHHKLPSKSSVKTSTKHTFSLSKNDISTSSITSPNQNSLRNQYKLAFLKERAIAVSNKNYTNTGSRIGNNQTVDSTQNTDSENILSDNLLSTTLFEEEDRPDFERALWSMEPRIFGVQKAGSRGYKYIVGNMGRFVDHYWRKCDPTCRHMYELIREKSPCRLYFDLEYCKLSNPKISEDDGEILMEELVEELIIDIKNNYGLQIDRSNIIDLDSSTNSKFSRHLVIHLPNGELFSNAETCGSFVKQFVGRLCTELATNELARKRPILAQNLFVNKASAKNKPKFVDIEEKTSQSNDIDSTQSTNEGKSESESQTQDSRQDKTTSESKNQSELILSSEHTCFIDLGVYTRNRLFRLLGSTKYGKPPSAALRLAKSNKFPFPPEFSNENFFLPDMEKSKPTHSKNKSRNVLDDVPVEREMEMKSFKNAMDWNVHADALASTLIVPLNSSKLPLKLLPNLFDDEQNNQNEFLSSSNSMAKRQTNNTKNSYGPSPFQSLDTFILETLGRYGGIQGSIRAWSMSYVCDLPTSITYQMKDNRWCKRIGRFHKSNNIMWTVDFRTMQYHQSCHDPECRAIGYKSNAERLPKNIEENVREYLFDLELASMDISQFTSNGNTTKKTPVKQLDEQDFSVNESFENALLALDISNKPNKQTDDLEKKLMSPKNNIDKRNSSFDEDGDDWNKILQDAIAKNPELYP